MITEIIWFFSWPLLIAIAWFAVNFVVLKFEELYGG